MTLRRLRGAAGAAPVAATTRAGTEDVLVLQRNSDKAVMGTTSRADRDANCGAGAPRGYLPRVPLSGRAL